MPHVRKEVFDRLKQEAETLLKKAQWDLYKNKYEIKRLAIEQNLLKKKVAEYSRLAAEFEKRKVK